MVAWPHKAKKETIGHQEDKPPTREGENQRVVPKGKQSKAKTVR